MQHQILHTMPIMQALAKHDAAPDIVALVRDAANLDFIERRLTDDVRQRITLQVVGGLAPFDLAERLIGRAAPLGRYGFVLRSLAYLKTPDLIVTPETTSLILKRRLPATTFVFSPHGAGDRAVSVEKAIAYFDHVLVPGPKTFRRMIKEGLVQPETATEIGYAKFCARNEPGVTKTGLFGNENPVFLYNPHFDPHLSSWYAIGEAVMDVFLARPHLNLIVAPHVMMYQRGLQVSKPTATLKAVPRIPDRHRDAPNILIDTGSERCVDMTYTRLADVYLGDVSSQVYEFIETPKPVLFLNPNRHNWQDNENFRFWTFGDVAETPDAIETYIETKAYGENRYVEAQQDAFIDTFGTKSAEADQRASEALIGLLEARKTRSEAVKASPIKRIFKNFGKLATGKVIAAVLSVAYLAILARALGPDGMGYLVLAHAYILIIARIARFQSWQAIIRFGEPLLAKGENTRFKTLVRFTAKLDLLSAVFAVALSLLLLGPIADVLKWPPEAMPWIEAYCWAGPFLFAATPTGVLQIADRFGTLSWQLLVLPGTRFVGAVALLFAGGSLGDFILVWIVSAMLHGISLWVLGGKLLSERELLPHWKRGPTESVEPGWWPFVIKTNLASTVELSHSHLPLLIVGAVLGGAASGFFQLAINLTNLIAHPANLLNEATFPELSKVNTAEGRAAMRHVAIRSLLTASLVALPIVLIYVLRRTDLAVLVGGIDFAPAGIVIAWMAAAQLARITSVVLESAVLALGGAGFVLTCQCISALCIIGALAALLPALGVYGAPIALLCAMVLLAALYGFYLRPRSIL